MGPDSGSIGKERSDGSRVSRSSRVEDVEFKGLVEIVTMESGLFIVV